MKPWEELERTLKVAYVNKERAAQHQETLLIKRVESTREQMIEEEMERQRQDLIRKEQEKDINRRHKLVDQKIVLQKQMKENEVRFFYQRQQLLDIDFSLNPYQFSVTLVSSEKNWRS